MAIGFGSLHGDMATKEEQDNLSRRMKKVKTRYEEESQGKGEENLDRIEEEIDAKHWEDRRKSLFKEAVLGSN